jgi:hypothetical protein
VNNIKLLLYEKKIYIFVLTARPIFLAIFESVMLAKGLSAPQHSTYFVIFDEGLVLDGMPGVAIDDRVIGIKRKKEIV